MGSTQFGQRSLDFLECIIAHVLQVKAPRLSSEVSLLSHNKTAGAFTHLMFQSAVRNPLRRVFPICLSILVLGILLAPAKASPTNASPANEESQLYENKLAIRRIEITHDSCHGSDFVKVRDAINDAYLLTGSSLEAASNFGEPPFSYFFKADSETATRVAGIYSRVHQALRGQGGQTRVTCSDFYNACEEADGRKRLAYTMEYAARRLPPLVIICPAGLQLPRLAKPCTIDAGDRPLTLGSMMLHELIHLQSNSGGDAVVDGPSMTPREIHDDMKTGKDTSLNALAYSLLGTWAWDLGLHGPPQRPCSEDFANGNFNGSVSRERLP